MKRIPRAVVLFAALATSCSTLEPYRAPNTITEYATIEDHPYRLGSIKDYDYVVSIDRKSVDSMSRGIAEGLYERSNLPGPVAANAIMLEVGVHKLEVRACKAFFELEHIFEIGGAWHCGRAVLRLDVMAGVHYRLAGSVNGEDDYAGLWIENARSHEKVAGPVRVSGLHN